jgi:Flp pilus assembly protein TadD
MSSPVREAAAAVPDSAVPARPPPGMVPVPLREVLEIGAHMERNGMRAESERMADHVLAAYPTNAEALHLKGLTVFAAGRQEDAARYMEGAIKHGLEVPLYYRNICAVYERIGRLDDAVAAGKRAVALDPTDAQAYHNLTVAHARRLELDECIACARSALALDNTLPGAHFALAEALLVRGELEEGWREYEWRFQIPGAAQPLPPTDRPQWDGAPLPDRTLLLVADQGFGDVIQFMRYIPWVFERCPKLVVACSPEVYGLIRQVSPPPVQLFTKWNECPEYAAYCVLSGLPRLHGTRIDNVPADVPYLRADPKRVERWRARIARLLPRGHRAVGIAWAGRPTHSNDRNRSAKLRYYRPIFDVPDTAFFAIQKGPPLGEVAGYYGRAPLINLGADIEDFGDTAAIMQVLDLVVTVDTSVAHLGAALGRPVWIMLAFAPDWRWLLDRSDTPWYPTVRLFRQRKPDDWEGVIASVAEALRTEST